MAASARWLDTIPQAVSSTGSTRLRFSITPTSWVVGQVGLEFAWDGGGYTTVINGTESADGYVLPRGAGEYLMVIKGASVFAGASTLPAAVTITANVVVQNPSDSSESDTAVLTASTTIYAPPSVTITSPTEGATVNALPITFAWDVTDATGISGQHIQFYGLDDYFPDPAARTYTIPSDLIENDTSYFVEIVASNGVGLSGRDGVNFTTHWAPPATPTAMVSNDPTDLSVSVTVFEGEGVENIGEFFAHSLTDSNYWYSANFSAAMTAAGNGWAHLTYTNSGSSWGYINVSPKAAAVSLTASSTYTYMAEIKNLTGGNIRVIAPSTSGTTSVWTAGTNTDFTEDGVAYVTATTLEDMSSATMVRTYLAVPANSTVTCDIRLSLYAGEYDGPYVPYDLPATTSLTVTRVNPDGTRWVVASGLRSGETRIDPLPPLGADYSYAITAVTEAGTTSVSTVAHTVESTAWALNFGSDGSEVLVMRYGQKLTRNPSHGGELYHFADGGSGDGYPVYYPTTDNDESLQLEFVAMTIDEADRLIRLARVHRTCWLRDQYGHRWLGVITPSVEERTWGVAFKVTANVDVVRFREAW